MTDLPAWEAWYFGRGAKQGQAFQYTTLFFFGMKEFTDLFIGMWDRFGQTNKSVACLWPNDTDANAFRQGFADPMKAKGYQSVDAGAYQDGISDFSAEIAKFKSAGSQLFTCTPIPPDFQTFWKQAAQQGFKPKLATVPSSSSRCNGGWPTTESGTSCCSARSRWRRRCGCPGDCGAPCQPEECGCSASGTGWT